MNRSFYKRHCKASATSSASCGETREFRLNPARSRIYLLLLFFSVLCLPSFSYAADVSLHGFFQGNYSFGTRSNPDGGDFKWAEERVQLKLDANKEPFRIFLKTDALYDHIDRKADMELREGYTDYTSGKWDLRLGRQVITWGVGDLIFINDVFPKDYEAFFSGRPMEYLKKGIDGVKIGAYPEFASFEFIAIPIFEPNNYPDSKRFYMFDPMPNVANREEKDPASNFENTEFAARAYRDIAGSDASVYFYRGFYRKPYMIPDDLNNTTKITFHYPKLSVYGASLQGRALDGVVSFEAGHYDSRQDRKGDDYTVPNSQTKALIGYQRQLWEDFTIGVQYFTEYMHNYSEYKRAQPGGLPKDRKIGQLVTARLTQMLMHQTLKLSLVSFYSTSEGDYLINPEIKYNFSDHIWAAIGGNIFGGGEKWSQFGQLAKNDNVYAQIRYEF